MSKSNFDSLSRRNFIKMAGVMMGAGALAACTMPVAPQAGQTAASEKPSIRFLTDWSTGTRGDVMSRAVEIYRSKYPDIQLVYEPSVESDVTQRVIVELAGGSAADVFISSGADFFNFWEKGAFLDLTDLVNADDELKPDDLYPQPGAFFHEGKWYGMPFQLVSNGCYYNKTLFDQAGLPGPRDYPDNPDGIWTWDDFLAAAKALTKDTDGDGETDQWGYSATGFEFGWLAWIWSNGGDYIDLEKMKTTLDQPEAVQAFQFVIDMIHKDKVMIEPTAGEQLATQLGVSGFIAGKVGITYSANATQLRVMKENGFEAQRCPFPRSPQTGLAIGGFNNQPNLVWSGTKFPQASYDLASFLAGVEVQTMIAESGQEPSRISVGESDSWLSDMPETKQAWSEQMAVAYDLRFHNKWREWYTEISVVADRATLGELTAEEAMVQATEVGDRVLSAAT
jgi:multiple sugar transport system substrate-binding protein